ncbi:c-type cytochrome [Magnetospirillum moscoviense]|uniref:Cytochrome C n=1 Tax=Magnetospirillum moscoviense TaxID=1437059 RepID=A0A178MC95_9PROT|nr:cytochrome c [Magnetospirillum moscoviense]OAN46379.1 cytochrome C [Magnetospirillum moscoviense]
MKPKIVIGLVVAAAVVAGILASRPWQRFSHSIDPRDAQAVAQGADLYRRHCAECHGADLKGEPDWRVRKPNGELPAPPHDETGHTWHHSDEQLFAMTKHGMSRFAPPDYRSAMPSFVGRLTDREIRSVLAYVKSTWPADIQARQQQLNLR